MGKGGERKKKRNRDSSKKAKRKAEGSTAGESPAAKSTAKPETGRKKRRREGREALKKHNTKEKLVNRTIAAAATARDDSNSNGNNNGNDGNNGEASDKDQVASIVYDRKEELDETGKRALSFDHKYILAPMVGASELPFRLLCRKYGAQAAYTPMMSAEKFGDKGDAGFEYRSKEFSTVACDRPLVCHFSANTPEDFKAAAVQAAKINANAIDLNLGCPQRTAFLGHFGSYLLDKKDRVTVLKMIKAAAQSTSLPVFVKIRLLNTYEDTKELVEQLHNAGASLIAIHARHRATWDRKGPGARDGPAKLDQVQRLKKELPHVRIVSNGNTITYDDVEKNLDATRADGIMSAEGLLDDPALFLGRYGGRDEPDKVVHVLDARPRNNKGVHKKTMAEIKLENKVIKWEKKLKQLEYLRNLEQSGKQLSNVQKSVLRDGAKTAKKLRKARDNLEKGPQKKKNGRDGQNQGMLQKIPMQLGHLYAAADDKVGLAKEYLELVRLFPATVRTVIFHTRRMCKQELLQYQLMEDCLACTTVDEVDAILTKIKGYQADPSTFQYDKERAQREKEAVERKKFEEGKRKRFEERMMRKAKREGKALDFYLKEGTAVPQQETIAKLKEMDKSEQVEFWKKNSHAQHCLAFHLGQCTRGRSCAFLHMDLQKKHGFEESEEVAG